jgi:hypothetical protein
VRGSNALVEELRAVLTQQRENARPDEPGEAAARLAEFQKLDPIRQRAARTLHAILRAL